MTIQTLILDDDANSRLAASTALEAYPEIEIVGDFSNSSQLFEFLQNGSADLLFLDIELNEVTGFSVAERLREEYPNLMIVFLTGHSSYAIDGYNFQPVNFLTKPINPVKLEQTIEQVRRRLRQFSGQRSSKLMFRLQQGYKILDVRDICYIERLHRKNYMHTVEETLCISGYTMHELEQMLEEHGFFLSHQSFLISLYRVQTVRDAGRQLYEVKLRGCEQAIPVSRYHYDELLKKLKELGMQVI
ncbi:MAG: LytTR family DNA-binding domain-containing protein [Ruminococcus sp.]|nr:LytTR family DNA-binding domain-containing protein [Ruminococcus sp.]